jgi:RNA polymerase sigma-70 factor (ECF subfamily)
MIGGQGLAPSLGARFAADEEGAIGDVFAALGPSVLGYLRRLLAEEAAEDVLQQVFHEMLRRKGRYDPSRSLTAWVFAIARNRAIDHLRRQRPTVPLQELPDPVGEDGRDLAERYVRACEVHDALSRLPDEQRVVLMLAYFGEYSQSDIAAYLGIPLGTVKARTFRGLRRLGRLLHSSDDPQYHPRLSPGRGDVPTVGSR